MRETFYNYINGLYPGSGIQDERREDYDYNNVNIGRGNKYLNLPKEFNNIQVVRSENFSKLDAQIFESVQMQMQSINFTELDKELMNVIIEKLFDKAIMNTFLFGESGYYNNEQSSYVDELLNGLMYWRNKTYEGKNVSFGLIIDDFSYRSSTSHIDNQILSVIKKDYFAPLTDGMTSFLKIDKYGEIIGIKQFDSFYEHSLLPYRFSSVTNMKNNSKTLILTRLGDLLLISNGEIKYTKKNRQWIQLSTNSLINKLTSYSQIKSTQLKESIFQSCMDVSFAKTGGVLAIVKSKNLDLSEFISREILNSEKYQTKMKLIENLIDGRTFQECSRCLRKELLSIDGSTIIDFEGNILIAGAIVKIDGGSFGGGRTAATVALSKYGSAIKISTDGYIQVYRDGREKPILEID